jgi:excisionase family DNA binding protein
MLTLDELCEWLNITERHARKLVERDAIPYRKVGHLLRFPEAEVEEWSRPAPKPTKPRPQQRANDTRYPVNSGNSKSRPKRRAMTGPILPKSLIE